MDICSEHDAGLTVGLEIHAQLNTLSKLFSTEPACDNPTPNIQISPLSLGYPGTLPIVNRGAIDLGLQFAMACYCEIQKTIAFTRKSYFYPDLPKGYQITQHEQPLAKGGYVKIDTKTIPGNIIYLEQIHLEEDSGKSLHSHNNSTSFIDLNRSGIPLIEVVTKPCIKTALQAKNFTRKIQALLRYYNISHARMEKGELRCDVNLSVNMNGSSSSRVEIKNLNSLGNIEKAIHHEAKRLLKYARQGKTANAETRGFNEQNNATYFMRTKDHGFTYRYMQEPDIPPIEISDQDVNRIKKQMPVHPDHAMNELIESLGIPREKAAIIAFDAGLHSFFKDVLKSTTYSQIIANILIGQVKAYQKQKDLAFTELNLNPGKFALLAEYWGKGIISSHYAKKMLLPLLLANPSLNLEQHIAKQATEEIDEVRLKHIAMQVIKSHPAKVKKYRQGKTGLLGFFMGNAMQKAEAIVEPAKLNKILKALLDEEPGGTES